MSAMVLLFVAIASEVIGTTALKLSEGFTRPVPSVLVVLGYGASFYLLSLALKQIPIGTTYAIWAGVGTAAIAIIGVLVWRESLDPWRIGGIALILAGVLVLNLLADSGGGT